METMTEKVMEESFADFYRLSEACISHVMSLTTPADSCRSSVVSKTFQSAVDSDTVWEKFLPSDYSQIIARAVEPVGYSSKKELYFRLCDPILIDGGRMSFALEKSSGEKCYMLSARELAIVWGTSPQYWQWIALPESRFSEVAELLNVCWLEIGGKIESSMLTPKTMYAAYLVYKLIEGAPGFDFPAQKASVTVGAYESSNTLCMEPVEAGLQNNNNDMHHHLLNWQGADPPHLLIAEMGDAKRPRTRGDGWLEIEMGEFPNEGGEDGEVHMWLREIRRMRWKNGLIIEGIEVRPKK